MKNVIVRTPNIRRINIKNQETYTNIRDKPTWAGDPTTQFKPSVCHWVFLKLVLIKFFSKSSAAPAQLPSAKAQHNTQKRIQLNLPILLLKKDSLFSFLFLHIGVVTLHLHIQ